VWWVKFYVDGQAQYEAAKMPDGKSAVYANGPDAEKQARKYLRNRLKEVHAHELDPSRQFVSQHDKRRMITELMDALKTDFEIRGKASAPTLSHIARARTDFGHVRAATLTAEQVDQYVKDRLEQGSAKASINRVTQLLAQAYKLAELPGPRIRKLSEKGNERKGFYSEHEIRRIIANLDANLGDFTLFGWLTGWRKNEIRSLRWEDVDGSAIRLGAIDAKDREARAVPLEGELAALIARRQVARQVMRDGTPMLCSLVFHRDGEAVGDFRKAWATACRRAGVPRLFHDLRRSACRNMIQAGVPQSVAMKISGHRTDSMFRRYAIVAESDLRTALHRTQEYLRTAKDNVVAMPSLTKNGDNSGTMTPSKGRKMTVGA
jgi:integrase